jgi:hypothetical protein
VATVDLGKIKFLWKGAYNASTAYTVDDVVESSGSSYVCIAATTGNAPPNATYWELMANKGTDGIDADLINIASTVQGDIYYNSGSAIARLAPGTSGQFLKTQGASANPVWGTVDPASIVNVGFAENSTRYALSDSANTALFTVNYTKIMSATESKIIVIGNIPGRGSYSDFMGMYFDCLTSGISVHNTNDSAAFKGISNGSAPSASRQGNIIINQTWENTTYLTAATHTFEFGWRTRNGSSGDKPFTTLNPSSSDDPRSHQHSSTFTFFEVLR